MEGWHGFRNWHSSVPPSFSLRSFPSTANHIQFASHLSHLVGLYPGYAVSNFAGQTDHSRRQILDAAEVSLIHRGNGTGPDADAGWGKVWRAACWAQLGNASEFYHELTVGSHVYRAQKEQETGISELTCSNYSIRCNATSVQTYFHYTTLAIRILSSKSTQTWDILALW